MTQNSHPAGTDGNPPPVSALANTTPGDLASGRPINPGNNELADKKTRNSARKVRRDTGESDVSDDESVAGSRAVSPIQDEAPVSQGNVVQFLSAFSTLPAAERRQIEAVFAGNLNKIPNSAVGMTGPLLSANAEQVAVSNSGTHKFGIHPMLRDLALNRQHLPLTLFLARSQRMMFLEQIPTETIRRAGSKVTIVKTDHFPSETSMDPTDWMEAWANYISFLEAEADAAVLKRWKDHYRFLSSCDDLKENFTGILRFDIEQRKEYMASPSIFDEAAYLRRFSDTKTSVMLEKMAHWERRDRNDLGARPAQQGKSRYEPYSRPGPPPPPQTQRNNPFPRGGGGAPAAPICLICARTGHRFSDCTFTQTEQGRPTWTRVNGTRLVSIAGGNPICVTWNIGNVTRCKVLHDDWHACSFCGNRTHHACSRTCI